jgi:hypothetical protein
MTQVSFFIKVKALHKDENVLVHIEIKSFKGRVESTIWMEMNSGEWMM